MLSTEELNKCIKLLADVVIKTNDNDIKMKLLEIGYTLKKELENVSIIESMHGEIEARAKNMGSLGIKRLLEDNIQLFNEKEHALKQNKELKDIIDSKLQLYEAKLNLTERVVNKVRNSLKALKN